MVDLVEKTNHMIEAGRPWISHYGLWVIAAGGLSQGIPIVGMLMPGLALNLAAGFLVGSGELPLLPTLAVSWASMYAALTGVYFAGRAIGKGRNVKKGIRRRLVDALKEDRWLLYYYFFAEPIRLALPYMAGSTGYPIQSWLLRNIPGSLVYVAFQVGLGLVFHAALGSKHPNLYFALLALAVVLAIFATARLAQKMLKGGD